MPTETTFQADFERQVEFDFLRATEIAALNTLQWLGKGEKEKADEAACDAIRGMFDLMDIRGEVVIGEGIKDEAPGLFKGENLIFTATGISQSPLLEGVEVRGSIATTHSVVMRARSGTVRFIKGHHDLERKTIHLRSTGTERRV